MFGPTGLGVLILINRQLVFREALSRLFVRQRANALGAKSIARIREGLLANDPFTSQVLSVRVCEWQQIAGVKDALRVDGLFELA